MPEPQDQSENPFVHSNPELIEVIASGMEEIMQHQADELAAWYKKSIAKERTINLSETMGVSMAYMALEYAICMSLEEHLPKEVALLLTENRDILRTPFSLEKMPFSLEPEPPQIVAKVKHKFLNLSSYHAEDIRNSKILRWALGISKDNPAHDVRNEVVYQDGSLDGSIINAANIAIIKKIYTNIIDGSENSVFFAYASNEAVEKIKQMVSKKYPDAVSRVREIITNKRYA